MKKIFKLFVILCVVSMVTLIFAAETWVVVPSVKNHLGGATIKITFPASGDSTDSQHSLPIFIGNINSNDAYIRAWTNATADYNPVFHFSNDLTKWLAVTASTLDATSTTVKYDTLGGRVLTAFHQYSWMVVENGPQSGVNITDVLYIDGNFGADQTGTTTRGSALKHSFYGEGNITDP
jgi:hypothetical protein